MSKRTKEWWMQFTPRERSVIVGFERYANHGSGYGGRGGYLPDDCSECGVCGCPTLGWGPCAHCSQKYDLALAGELGNWPEACKP